MSSVRGLTANAICPGLFMTEPNRTRAKKNPNVIETFVGVALSSTAATRSGEAHSRAS